VLWWWAEEVSVRLNGWLLWCLLFSKAYEDWYLWTKACRPDYLLCTGELACGSAGKSLLGECVKPCFISAGELAACRYGKKRTRTNIYIYIHIYRHTQELLPCLEK
jgi:hypothetical protein